MKALNRAISRTAGHIIDLCAFHIDRTGTQGCAVKQTPETLKQLEQHLAAMLEMERKQLGQDGFKYVALGPAGGGGSGNSGVLVHSGGVGGSGAGNSGAMIAGAGAGSTIAFSTPQAKGDSLFERFVSNGMMEQDGFREQPAKMSVQEWAQKAMTIAPRDTGAARALGITPASILAQMSPGCTTEALEKACEAASNFASEGARYLLQRDDALAALESVLESLEYVEKHMPGMTGFMVRQERIARAKTVIANIKGSAASEQPQLPAYQVGDMLERVRHGNKQWTVGKLYEIQKVDGDAFQLLGDDGRPYWTRQDNLAFSNRGKVVPPPPAPDVINMTDPRNWQVGDVLMCSDGNAFLGFNAGDECAVAENNETYVVVRRNSGTAVALHHDKPTESAFFTWLRHGEAQQ